ncbi:MAG: serine/threonine-protein kinase [Planctomycetaceae bacterium]
MSSKASPDQDGSPVSADVSAATEIGVDAGASAVGVIDAVRLPPDSEKPVTIVPAAGVKFGRFELISVLGCGGFGEVWKCWDTSLDRHVALKFAKAGVSAGDPGFSLRDEARKVSKLSHPGIVHIYDVVEAGSQFAIVSELIDGQTLAQRLKSGALSFRECAAVIRDVAAGLQHAHQQDLVHRDVKPSNILLRRNGTAALTDFGLAASEVQFENLRRGTSGTLKFMSPEQARGDTHLLDNRSDIFCLGIVLFHALTLKFPFPESRNQNSYRQSIATRNAKSLRVVDASIPKVLDQICSRCLAFNPVDRYRTAQDLADDLESFLASEPETQVSTAPHSTPKGGLVAVALILVIAVTAAVLHLRPAGESAVGGTSNPDAPAAPGDAPEVDRPGLPAPPGAISLTLPPKIFAWPYSDSRGVPQHSPETQTWSVRSETTRFIAVCGELQARQLRIDLDVLLENWTGAAGVIWGLRKNADNVESVEYLCYGAEFSRTTPELDPTLTISEFTLQPLDAQEMIISHVREIRELSIAPPTTDWVKLSFDIRPGRLQPKFNGVDLPEPIDVVRPASTWLPNESFEIGVTGMGAKVAFRNLSVNR